MNDTGLKRQDTASNFVVGGPDFPRTFDFSPQFEDVILVLLPSLLLLVLAPARYLFLVPRQNYRGHQLLKLSKLGVIIILGGIRLSELVLDMVTSQRLGRFTIIAAAFSFGSIVPIAFLSTVEHARSPRPSILLTTYLLTAVVCSIVRTRSLWRLELRPLATVVSIGLALETMALVLECRGKRSTPARKSDRRSPEEYAGPFSLSLYWWLNGLLRKGYQSVLALGDLYVLESSMSSESINAKFQAAWPGKGDSFPPQALDHASIGANVLPAVKPCTKNGYLLVVRVLAQGLWAKVLLPIPPKLALLAFTFCQPLALTRMIAFLENDENINIGYGLMGAYALIYVGLAVSGALYGYHLSRLKVDVRCALVSAIYEKTVLLGLSSRNNSAAVTLMSADTTQVSRGLGIVHEVWSNVIQVCLATWLLQRQIGLVCLVSLATSIIAALLTIWVSGKAGSKQAKWMECLAARIGFTAEFLSLLKAAKLIGAAGKLADHVQILRRTEIAAGNRFRTVVAWAITLAFSPSIVAPAVTFGVFVALADDSSMPLDVSRMFTSLSLILLMTQPLSGLFQQIPQLWACLSCCQRIQDFLVAEHWHDYRSQQASSDQIVPSMAKSEACSQSAVCIQNGSFGWTDQDGVAVTVLRDINMAIPKGSLTIVRGPVASGKSTLLKALLGEAKHLSGAIHVADTSIAYCDQDIWLQNKSVRDNIICSSTYDEKWYLDVVKASALEEDMQLWTEGDQTAVGSKGVTLSGGQKRRVSLARAVYARRPVVVLDNVLDGLDKATESYVLRRIFGPNGILRQQLRCTIIIASHSDDLLAVADQMIELDEHGQAHCQHLQHDEVGGCSEAVSPLGDASPRVIEDEISQEESPRGEGSPESKPSAKAASAENDRAHGDLSMYKFYFSSSGWGATLLFAVLQVLFGFFNTFPNVWLKWWSEADATNQHNNRFFVGVYCALQFLSLMSICLLCWHTLTTMISKAGKSLHASLLDTVLSASLRYLTETDAGVLLNRQALADLGTTLAAETDTLQDRFSQDLEIIDGDLPEALIDLFATALICLGQMALLALPSWYLALGYPVIFVVIWCIQRCYLRTSRQIRLLDLETKSPLYSHFLETLSGLATIRAFGWEQESKETGAKLLNDSQIPFYLLLLIQHWLSLVLDMTCAGMAVLIVGLAAATRHSASLGFTAVAMVSLISFSNNLKVLVSFWTMTETSLGALVRIKSFAAEVEPEWQGTGELPEPPPGWPAHGTVDIRDLSVAYKSSLPPVLRGVSLSVAGGTRLAICGRSGSGKSTLVSTLLGLLQPQVGSITLDGVDLKDLHADVIRSRVIVVSQDICLYTGTVRFNMDPYGQSSDAAILAALERLGLREAIQSMGGLDGEMTLDSLSQGQRQLFSLARAALRPGKIVILDEATSGVDTETEKRMHSIIKEDFAGRTIIAITHMLQNFLYFDTVAVIKEGTIAECGNPRDLLASKSPSEFRNLYESSPK